MNDLEISKALALAIGWREDQVSVAKMSTDGISWIPACVTVKYDGHKHGRPFWYTDWNVIGQIAERYDCFPQLYGGEWCAPFHPPEHTAETPQKAIALAVIGAKQ